MIKRVFSAFSSLRLTVFLLGTSMVLIFLATLDQVHWGVHFVQKRYFESWFVAWQYPESWLLGDSLKVLYFPLPGGYLLGVLLFINLLSAHFKYFKAKWSKVGIAMIHGGLLLLLISAFVSGVYQKEFQMWVDLGQSQNFGENFRDNEVVLIDTTESETNKVISLPERYFNTNKVIEVPETPFKLKFHELYGNADIGMVAQNPGAKGGLATQGIGKKMDLFVQAKPMVFNEQDTNAMSGYVEVFDGEDESLGVWMVSNIFGDQFPAQTFTHKDRKYELALRFRRHYLPFELQLVKFTHERYPGTEIPKDFSSRVIIKDPAKPEDREVLISMNNPLRYAGYTFFQASFGNDEKASMLQVVQNPGRLLPYVAVYLVGLGLLFHFLYQLVKHLGRRRDV